MSQVSTEPAYGDSDIAAIGSLVADRARCRILLDAYRVKWSCIILNDFLPVGAARRSFADAGAWDSRCQKQIKKAEAKIGEIHA